MDSPHETDYPPDDALDGLLFTGELPAPITLQKNLGRAFTPRGKESQWYLMPLELFVSLGTSIGGFVRRLSGGIEIWDSIRFQKSGTILLTRGGARKGIEIAPDTILLVSGEVGLNPSAAADRSLFSLIDWKYVELICNDGSHLLVLSASDAPRVFTLIAQTNPFVVGVDAAHQIYLPPAMRGQDLAAQRQSILVVVQRILKKRRRRNFLRAVFALAAGAAFAYGAYGWILAGWRIRLGFWMLVLGSVGGVVTFGRVCLDNYVIYCKQVLLKHAASD
jgi:hypothetical protein